jgi:hypothetical protein
VWWLIAQNLRETNSSGPGFILELNNYFNYLWQTEYLEAKQYLNVFSCITRIPRSSKYLDIFSAVVREPASMSINI